MRLTVASIMWVALLQLVSAQQLPSVAQQRFTTKTGTVVEVQNLSTSELTAFEARYKCNGRLALSFHFDTLLNLSVDRPVHTGGISTYQLPDAVGSCPGGVVAALFSDGHSEGDLVTLAEIRQKRAGVLAELQALIDNTSAVTRSFDPNLIVQNMNLRLKQVAQDQSLSRAEREGRMYILDIMVHMFTNQTVSPIPSGGSGNTIPTTKEFARTSNLPIAAAHAIVMNRRVQQWVNAFTPQALGDLQSSTH